MPLSRVLAITLRLIAVSIGLAAVVLAALWYPSRPPKEMRGIWQSEGYGLVFDISPFRIRIHEISPVSCLPWQSFPAHLGLARTLAGYDMSVVDGKLRVEISDIINDVTALKRDELPSQCLQGRPAGPRETYDVFWQTLATYYPFFDLHGVDWDARRATALADIGESYDPAVLVGALKESLSGIEDRHVNLITPEGDYTPKVAAAWDKDARDFWQVSDSYLVSARQIVETGGIRHGWLDGDIAYMAFHHMETEPSLADQQVDEAQRIVAGLAAVYANAKGVIIDNRFNNGGSDAVALIYAGLFSGEDWSAGTKVTQIAPGQFTPPVDVIARASPSPLSVPVVVMNSRETVSAGEVFALALRELAQVRLIGENTNGSLSDMMVRDLPNGWQFTLSHQVYRDPKGDIFEGTGIPPHETYTFDVAGFSEGRDTLLERALAMVSRD